MVIRIERVLLENFKLFSKLLVDFSSANFIVFDGPNGYGKTSFYDALELFFTGQIRRYDEWVKIVTDGRETFKENPYLNNRSDEGDLAIKVELKIGDEKKVLMRRGKRAELNRTTKISDMKFDLLEISNFDDLDGVLIEEETAYMEKLLGQNYCENFQFLHYIEQEENIVLLKNKDKDRKSAIDYLFNTVEFQSDLDRLKEVIAKTTELCGSSETSKLVDEKKAVDDLGHELTVGIEQVKYSRLLGWKSLEWDREEMGFKEGQFSELVGKDGLLEKIKQFKINISEFKEKRENDLVDKKIKQIPLLTQLIRYYKYLDDVGEYINKMAMQKEIDRIKKEYSMGTLKAVVGGQVRLDKLQNILGNKIDVEEYKKGEEEINKLYKNLNSFSEAVNSLRESRRVFSVNFDKYEIVSEAQKECPMCGFDWETTEQLKQKLQKQEIKIEQLAKEADQNLLNTIEQFEKVFVNRLQGIFDEYLLSNKVDGLFVEGLQEAVRNKDVLKDLYADLAKNNIKVEECLCEAEEDKPQEKLETLIGQIEALKKEVDGSNLQPYFPDIFLKYFDEHYEHIESVSLEDVEAKIKYIKWEYSTHQSRAFKRREEEYVLRKERYENALNIKAKLGKIKRIYKKSLEDYQKKIIGDIEILFHIYSGRIIQDCQGGMGLFICDKSGIRFLEDPKKTHDALFTMSSGQLAVLIIAFTLTLNKKYSKNKLLFVDDPVQTLDELNITSLVELLRTEFADRQIFLSTHEDKMSAYMRYKFEKYGIETKQLSFKDKYLKSV